MTTNSHSEDIARSGVEADASSTEGLLILNGILGWGGGSLHSSEWNLILLKKR